MVRNSQPGPGKPAPRESEKSKPVTPSSRRWARTVIAGGAVAAAGGVVGAVVVDPASGAPISIAIAVAGLLVNMRKTR